MKLAIFGATGKTGIHLVRKALERGHKVTALARTPSKMNIQHSDLTIIQGDVRDADVVSHVIEDADGVISAIGPTPNSPEDLMVRAAENIVSTMHKHGVDRLIWSTGAGVRAEEDQPTFMHKAINFALKTFAKSALENSLRGVEMVQNSDLEWTIARAPMLTDEPGSGNFYIGYVGSEMGRALSRENFADLMLDLVESDEWVQEMPAASDK